MFFFNKSIKFIFLTLFFLVVVGFFSPALAQSRRTGDARARLDSSPVSTSPQPSTDNRAVACPDSLPFVCPDQSCAESKEACFTLTADNQINSIDIKQIETSEQSTTNRRPVRQTQTNSLPDKVLYVDRNETTILSDAVSKESVDELSQIINEPGSTIKAVTASEDNLKAETELHFMLFNFIPLKKTISVFWDESGSPVFDLPWYSILGKVTNLEIVSSYLAKVKVFWEQNLKISEYNRLQFENAFSPDYTEPENP